MLQRWSNGFDARHYLPGRTIEGQEPSELDVFFPRGPFLKDGKTTVGRH